MGNEDMLRLLSPLSAEDISALFMWAVNSPIPSVACQRTVGLFMDTVSHCYTEVVMALQLLLTCLMFFFFFWLLTTSSILSKSLESKPRL